MVTFIDTESQLTEKDIAAVESLSGLSFPPEYRSHLLKHNGGACTPDVFSFEENGSPSESNVDWFLAIYDGDTDNLIDYIETYKLGEKRMPDHMLPIAHDPGGNLVCISCGSNDYGKIYFWDHDNEVDYGEADDNDHSNLYLIAESFNQFIAGLKEG